MEKKICEIDKRIKKIHWINKSAIAWVYENSGMILDYMTMREKILNKTRKKLIGCNKFSFINWSE